jgi:hypothetical protein
MEIHSFCNININTDVSYIIFKSRKNSNRFLQPHGFCNRISASRIAKRASRAAKRRLWTFAGIRFIMKASIGFARA